MVGQSCRVIGAVSGQLFEARYLWCFAVAIASVASAQQQQNRTGMLSFEQPGLVILGPDTHGVCKFQSPSAQTQRNGKTAVAALDLDNHVKALGSQKPVLFAITAARPKHMENIYNGIRSCAQCRFVKQSPNS